MNTGFVKAAKLSQNTNTSGFTLLELLVVIGVIAVLIAVQVPVLAGGKSQSKIAMCASHVRQLALACQIYANENGDRLPVLPYTPATVWVWDTPLSTVNALLNSGAQTNTFYCPGTAPRLGGAAPIFEATIRHSDTAAVDARREGLLTHELEGAVVRERRKVFAALREHKTPVANLLVKNATGLASAYGVG